MPVLELDDGRHLAESNAILWYLADGTEYVPDDPTSARRCSSGCSSSSTSTSRTSPSSGIGRCSATSTTIRDSEQRRERGHGALAAMERHLAGLEFFVGDRYSIADIALYAYTHVAHEGGFDLAGYPAINAWLERVAASRATSRSTTEAVETSASPSFGDSSSRTRATRRARGRRGPRTWRARSSGCPPSSSTPSRPSIARTGSRSPRGSAGTSRPRSRGCSARGASSSTGRTRHACCPSPDYPLFKRRMVHLEDAHWWGRKRQDRETEKHVLDAIRERGALPSRAFEGRGRAGLDVELEAGEARARASLRRR